MIDRLRDDHERVAAIVKRLEPFLDRDAPPVEPEFAQLRWTLLREFVQHHAVEQAALFPSARPRATATAYDQGLSVAFKDHMTEWTGAALHANWTLYRSAARALIARLRRQMQHEEAVLFPGLIARSDPPGR